MEVQSCFVEQLHHLSDLLLSEGGTTTLMGIHIGGHLGSRLDSQCTIHEHLESMDFQMLGVELLSETLHLFHDLFHLLWIGEGNTSVDINWQLALFVELTKTLIDALVKCIALRKTCIEDSGHTCFYRIIYPAHQLCIDLLVCHIDIIEEHIPRRRLEGISCHMSVLTYIITEFGHAIRCLVSNVVSVKDLGVHPDAMALAFQNQEFSIRADGIEIFLHDVFPLQVLTLQNESVAFQARIALDALRHKVECFLFAGAHNVISCTHISESNTCGHMHMAVDDARHDEFPTQVGDFTLIR